MRRQKMRQRARVSSMDRTQRARALLDVVALLSQAQAALDALAVGDTSTMPSELKHTLDAPKEAIRAYARALYMGAMSGKPTNRAGIMPDSIRADRSADGEPDGA